MVFLPSTPQQRLSALGAQVARRPLSQSGCPPCSHAPQVTAARGQVWR